MQKISHIKDSSANEIGEFVEANSQKNISGTLTKAAWFNTIQRELITCVEGFGGTLDLNNDQQIAQIVDSITPIRLQPSARNWQPVQANPIYPHVLNESALLSVIIHQNELKVDDNQCWLWHGIWKLNSSDYDIKSRTFLLNPNSLYHLRWRAMNGFSLCDLHDSIYNPSALSENHTTFDSTYDDMLIARINCNSNTVDVTPLKNQHAFTTTWTTDFLPWSPFIANKSYDQHPAQAELSLNLARTPEVYISGRSGFNLGSEYHTKGADHPHAFGISADRYSVKLHSACLYTRADDLTAWHVGIRL